MNRLIMTDGAKSINLLNSDDPSVWTFYSNAPKSTQDILYGRVSAAFRAYNLKANTVGNMPFALNTIGGEEYDNSATWENKVGFLPNPSELFRLDTLSYIATNTIYNVKTTDALGYKQRGLYHAVAYNFHPFTHAATGALEYVERKLGTGTERYAPTDKRLVRMWRLDHTTEVLPSANTEAQAIMNAAGEVYAADLWIKHFYERGGVPPTVIAMKGAVAPNKKDEEEKSWGDWLRGLGRYLARPARVFNADALDVKQFGSSVTDLKNNEVYQRAITNIAMGTGMPLSLLMANSANYATAKEEKATWYENDIIPFCNWLAYNYNEQVFKALDLMLVFNPETLQSQQQDEREVAQAYSTYINTGMKPSVAAKILGIELPDDVTYEQLDEMKEEKDEQALERQEMLFDKDKAGEEKPKDKEKEADKEEKKPFGKWIPSLNELEELKTWRKATLSAHKQGKPLTFEYIPHYGGLPETVTNDIKARLAVAQDWTPDIIKAAFDVVQTETITQPDSEIKRLADAINNLADKAFVKLTNAST